MFRLVLTAWLFACVQPWTLTSSHSSVVPGFTTNVTLRCSDDGNHKINFSRVLRMRIQKFGDDNQWHNFAVNGNGQSPVTPMGDGVSSTGHTGVPKDSFLEVTWSEARQDTVGRYKCDIVGTDTMFNILKVTDIAANITKKSLDLDDVLQLVSSDKKRSKEDRKTLQGLRIVVTRGENDRNLLNKTQMEIEDALDELEAEHNSFNSTIKKLKETVHDAIRGVVEQTLRDGSWPEGPMAFPAPQSGCPRGPINAWHPGTLTLHRYFEFNPKFSGGNHLRKPLTSNPDNIKMHFCTKKSKFGRNWPQGSYCFGMAKSAQCPFGFTESQINLNAQGTDQKYYFEAVNDDGPHTVANGHSLSVLFCCRHDGNATSSIVLPSHEPFFLYRHNGQCQAVRNANVTSESMTLATVFTELSISYSYREGTTSVDGLKFSPDGGSSKLELCYYTPQA